MTETSSEFCHESKRKLNFFQSASGNTHIHAHTPYMHMLQNHEWPEWI